MIVAPGWSVLSFNSELVAGDAWRFSCLFRINLVIDDVVVKAVVQVHVSKASIALNVALIIAKICMGQHDTMQNIMNPKDRVATLHVINLRAVLGSVIFSSLISVGSNIEISLILAAFRSTSLTLLRSTNSFFMSMLSVSSSCPSVVRLTLWTS